MNETSPALQALQATTGLQRKAAEPGASAWVSANAGSGKTHVLVNRVIRLMLAGADPSSILCLTYTKAAAAEMAQRVFRTLGTWIRLDDQALAKTIEEMQGRPASPGALVRARRLFAMALETPGGLKIQTIHAFCEAVLHRFPLEANVPARFSVLDDARARAFLEEARSVLLSGAGFARDAQLEPALATILEVAGDDGLDGLLGALYARRRLIKAFIARENTEPASAEKALRLALGLRPEDTRESAMREAVDLPGFAAGEAETFLEKVGDRAGAAVAWDIALGVRMASRENDPETAWSGLKRAFLTKEEKPRSISKIETAKVLHADPDFADRAAKAQAHVVACLDRLKALSALDFTKAALVVARSYLGTFEGLKARHGLLDFDDEIAAAADLLNRDGANAWVHYKLDQGINHVLVDEAQDTAPLQWSVISALVSEFFIGASARPGPRTMFAVGDVKQSIYSFQGAEPARFLEEKRRIEWRAAQSHAAFHEVPLTVSFRSAKAILDFVDLVFSVPDTARGVAREEGGTVHETVRLRAPGAVEIWPVVAMETAEDEESWTAPFDEVPEKAPAARVAARVAASIRELIGRLPVYDKTSKTMRPCRAGDILVLVRKRDGFVPALLRMLKAGASVPVAGADRLRLTDHIAVQDLIALGRFCLNREDDLALAGLFKSPLVGLGEDDLFQVSRARGATMSLWKALLSMSEDNAAFQKVASKLKEWMQEARFLSPHEFYARLLGPGGGRAAYLARLGDEVSDVLDEFLAAALTHEQDGLPGLEPFLATLVGESPEIKREMEQETDAVRVMTVHASKGLEAPVVFLVDQGGAAVSASQMPRLYFAKGPEGLSVPLWFPKRDHEPKAAQPLRTAIEQAAEEEYRRLLYVGMTRAADRLILCGFRGKTQPNTPTWHGMVEEGFVRALDEAPDAVETVERIFPDGAFAVNRFVPVPEEAASTAGAPEEAASPSMMGPVFAPLPPPAALPRPLAPSGAGAIVEDDTGSPTGSPFGSASRSSPALERGSVIHRLLETLPGIAADKRADTLDRYLARAYPEWERDQRDVLAAEVRNVLESPDYGELFAEGSRAEVSVMGRLIVKGEERAVSGRIDRLSVGPGTVLIADFKTGFNAPAAGQPAPQNHAMQMAIYAALLEPLFPDHTIEAALVYTSVPRLVRLDAETLKAMIRDREIEPLQRRAF